MSHFVQIRANYSSDTQYLFRLAEAIENDKEQPKEWRQQASIKIYELIQLFCKANERKMKKHESET